MATWSSNCTGKCRNNVGNWKTKVISANANEKGYEFYALKDREMAKEADYGFMFWHGKSRGAAIIDIAH